MPDGATVGSATQRMLLRRGLALEYLTLGWNVVGCVVLLAAAVSVGSVALAAFGVDSVIEIVASLVVVWQLRGSTNAQRDGTALRVIAVAFAALAVYLGVQVAVTLTRGSHAGHSTAGIAWLALTVFAMLALAVGKRDTGHRLRNAVLATEARVTLIDAAVAAAVLTGVALNAAAGWWWADPASAGVILLYAAREARHAWQAAGRQGTPLASLACDRPTPSARTPGGAHPPSG
jgi:divalent metal cation (Fe/Co/Zn/Cd) transporter